MIRRTAHLYPNNGCQIFSFQRAIEISPPSPFRATADSSMRESSSFELDSRIELVENTGIEPVTSCVQGRRSPS